MRRAGVGMLLCGGIAAAGLSSIATADSMGTFGAEASFGSSFERIASLPNYLNNAHLADETVAEIVAATKNGKTLIYTDSELEEIGFVDLTKPHQPISAGKLGIGGEPTSVDVLGNHLALVAVDATEELTDPQGHLNVVNMQTRQIIATLPLGGQPDSTKISSDGRYAAIVIENERDEDIEIGGVEGGLPQQPSGSLVILDLHGGNPANWTLRTADLTGLAAYAPEDAEPEFVDINDRHEAVVTLQENNHVAIVDLRTGQVVADFDAGMVNLTGIDATEDGLISLTEPLSAVPREPDAVAWLPGPGGDLRGAGRRADVRLDLIATANEGDLFGGSRGFSIFDRDGNVLFDSANWLEAIAVRHGHYPEHRSANKGSEPEAIEYARFGDTDYLFVASERGSFIAVYELQGHEPEFRQLLPAPLGPEGLLAIPQRGLLIASGEEDDPSFGVRSTIAVYALGDGEPSYPQIASANGPSGAPIGWSALSGMVAVPGEPDRVLAVWDSFYREGRIFTIDVAQQPALVTEELPINGGSRDLDAEGIAVAPDGTYWVASEGNAGARSNRLLQIDTLGNVIAEINLPAAIETCRAASANRGSLGSGFEGLAAIPSEGHGYVLAVAQQRGWDYTTAECEHLDDDPNAANAGEPTFTRIWLYNPQDTEWNHVAYELEPVPQDAAWVGLSEITRVGDSFIIIERDNRTGDFAALKTLVKFGETAMSDGVISRDEKQVYDLLPALEATNGWITDKPEGVAVTGDGEIYVVTDNDGVEDWSGETWFLRLGAASELFE